MDFEFLLKEIESIKSKITIDQFQLEGECLKQPVLFERVASLSAEAKAESRRAKEDMEAIKAETELAVRASPEAYGISKVTESTISAAVSVNESCRLATKKFIDVQEISDKLIALEVACEQRKSAVRDLITLFIHNYYSQTKTPMNEEELRGLREKQLIEMRKQNAQNR